MSANFWQSSHGQQWILDKQKLLLGRQYDLQFLTEDEYNKIFIFFSNVIQVIGEQIKLHQQVIATATVYFKRFYSKHSVKNIAPLLILPACLNLASKIEEFGIIPPARLIQVLHMICNDHFRYAFGDYVYPFTAGNINGVEFYLLEGLEFCLIVYQPYRSLAILMQDIGNADQLQALTWRLINDSLRTDVCLLHPPHLIAIGCLKLASVILQKDLNSFFAELQVDMEEVQQIVQAILDLFELIKSYDEKKDIHKLLVKMPKPESKKYFS